MISKVITFKDNNNNALLPISDARAVQITYANVTKSVHDAILDTEEAIATTYNNLTSRIDGIEYDLNNPAVLNTNNTASQTPMSNERIEGNIYLHKVAKTGSWDDLNNKPTIPAAPVKSNWNETNSSSLAYILNKPTIPAAPGTLNTNNTSAQSVSSSESLSGNIKLHRISKTGNYNDLTHYPYETKVLVSKHINTAGTTQMITPAGNFMISCTATGSTASFNITAIKGSDNWEWSTTDGKIFAEYEYVSNSSGAMTITVFGTLANDTDIVITIYDVINGTGDYSVQLGLNGYIEGKRISRVGQVAVTNDYNDLINKPTIPTVPTNVSAFTNDAGYLTQHQSLANYYTKTETNNNFSKKTEFDSADEIEADGPTANLDFAYDDSNGTIYWSDANNSGVWKRLLDIDDLKEVTMVNVTQNGSTYTMDKSCSQVLSLVDSNDTVVLNYNDLYFHFAGRNQDELNFVNIDIGHGYMYEFYINGNSTGNTTYYHVITNINGKQDTLVSGTNIKTVNNESLLGSGNIDADDVILGKMVEESANPRTPSITIDRFYKFLGTFSSSGGTLPVYTPDYSSTAETGNVNKIYVDITTRKAYWYDSRISINGGNGAFVELCQTDLSNYYTKSEIDDSISNAKTTKFGYLDSSGDFYEAYWSTLTNTTTSYYLPAVDQNTLSYTDNLYIDINTGKNYRYKNGTLGTGETRFEEIKPYIAKEKIIRTDRKRFTGTNSINMESKYFYIFGAEDDENNDHGITALTIASLINSYDDDKYENDFHGMVYCEDMTFTIPDGILIANNAMLPDMEWGYIFEFHILNNILTFTYTKWMND